MGGRQPFKSRRRCSTMSAVFPKFRRNSPMPSFDIVSKTDFDDIDTALQSVEREIAQRYDFKGSRCTIERKEQENTINADDELKLKQMHALLQGHLARRKVDPGVPDYKEPEKAAG